MIRPHRPGESRKSQDWPIRQLARRWAPLPPLRANPLVTVVVPSYNLGSYIEETILSVLRQDYEPIELIIADGGSKDNTLEILHKYEKDPRVSWISEPDSGPHEANNKGMRLAKGELIGILTASDTYQHGAIREAVQEFAAERKLALVFGNAYETDVRGVVIKVDKCPTERVDLSVDDIITFKRNYGWLQATFFRRDLALAIGGFDEEKQTVHCYSLCCYMLEASRMGAASRRVSKIWATYRRHPNTMHEELTDAFAWERNVACKQIAEEYKDYLNSQQYKLLYRTAYFSELYYRNQVLRQSIRAIPAFMGYVRFGGDLLLLCRTLMSRTVIGRFLKRNALLHRMVRLTLEKASKDIEKKDVGKEMGEEIGMDTRWYLEPTREDYEPQAVSRD